MGNKKKDGLLILGSLIGEEVREQFLESKRKEIGKRRRY